MSGAKAAAIVLIAIAVLIFVYIGYSLLQGETTGQTSSSSQPFTPTPKPRPKSKQKPKPKQKVLGTSPQPTRTRTKQSTTKEVTSSRETTTAAPKYETGFFRYRWLKYRVRIKGTEIVYTFENLGEEAVDGKLCYHQRVTVEGPQRSEMEIWYDKATGECVKVAVSIPGVGRKEVPCSSQPGASAPVSGKGMRYVGEETVTVPAGTFDCTVFEGSGYRSWISKQGLLVKWVSQGAEGVLLGYG